MTAASRLLAALALAAALAAPAFARDASTGALRKPVDRILDRAGLDVAFWGVEVRRLRDGKVLYSRNATRHFTPASTTKLLTTAAALDAFGADHRLATTLQATARIDGQGRLLGDLYLVGAGDPSLGQADPEKEKPAALEVLADALRAAGVKRIEGGIVGHEGLFAGDRRGDGWDWDDLTWWYGAEVSALSWNDNAAELRVAAGEREGDLVVAHRLPESRYYSLRVTARTAAAGSEPALKVTRAAGNAFEISGTLPLGGEPWKGFVALEDPALYAATVFAETLAARGVTVMAPPRTSSAPLPPGSRELGRFEGPTMAELIAGVNKPSQNLHAEMLLRLLGARAEGAPGDVEKGLKAAAAFRDRVGVRDDSWRVEDGSGLSRLNLIGPQGLVDLLVAMHRHPHAAAFRASLPVAGQDGTLKRRMKDGPAAGKVLAKTGTLTSANALGGYVDAKSGPLVFALFANHHTVPGREATAAADALMELLVRQ